MRWNSEISAPAARPLFKEDLFERFSLGEALRMAYLPIILTKSAFEYAEFARRLCAENRLPYNKESRLIRNAMEEYGKRALYNVRLETLKMLQAKVDEFFDEADNSLQVLWYTIKNQLMKQFPDIGNYDLLSNAYVSMALLDYVHKFELVMGLEISRRTGAPYVSMVSVESMAVRKGLSRIAEGFKMEDTEMLRMAIRSVALKVDKLVDVVMSNAKSQLAMGDCDLTFADETSSSR